MHVFWHFRPTLSKHNAVMFLQRMARVKGVQLPRVKKKCQQKLAQTSRETSAGKSHRGQKLNKGNPENMRKAVEEYNVQKTMVQMFIHCLYEDWLKLGKCHTAPYATE